MDEKRKIIDMVADGKISAQEGERLLTAMTPISAPTVKGKKLIIRITQEGKSKPKVNIALPLNLAKIAGRFIPKSAKINANLGSSNFDFSSIDWKEIVNMASSGEVGDLFFMEIEEDDGTPTTIRIFVE